jgi:hypothetical protein
MLWTPAAAAPRREPFLVVDEDLVVQAISRYAEAVLTVNEPASVAAPLDSFLSTDANGNETDALARLVRLAAAGTPADDALQMLTAHDSPRTFSVRVTSCGPPLAAMVILAPGAPSGAEASRAPSKRPAKPPARGRTASGDQKQPEARDDAERSHEPRTAEETLTDLAGRLIVSGQRLAERRSDIGTGLAAIAGLREELEQAERELVELARRDGLSWAQIVAELKIIQPTRRS